MIALDRVTIRAGTFELSDVSATIPTGTYAALMGRTGRGKTTILEAICGLRAVTSGSITIGSTDVTHWPPGDRQVGYVPQDLALFPTLTVQEHLEFALRLRRVATTDIASRTSDLAGLLGISHLTERRIQGLSGGERQRVALGRALSFQPAVLLLDEPLSALDETTREEILSLLLEIKRQTGVTTLHVTHNRSEADTLADTIFQLNDGKLTGTTDVDSRH
ncbi:ABC transporter ATP-binding protein [Crateriforma conspicua]|uniref:Sulfate/thiosulfate import ATP-binding protein CysA n=1 Tax=Crateriforma conspicua TaxID=2527996 RepID=A0A5C5Y773_9PLAN|nr:ABC transporter ATP-binding protein [Crateriforma conspicua]QDV65634.1 Sulfate/thiosulfate import ATP-binding protein CysA [Crateriforma conspicua]TWT71034.1 Sulfate/thiosulfate import ATP-binding protein CysA [Crateriforma conspicua]